MPITRKTAQHAISRRADRAGASGPSDGECQIRSDAYDRPGIDRERVTPRCSALQSIVAVAALGGFWKCRDRLQARARANVR